MKKVTKVIKKPLKRLVSKPKKSKEVLIGKITHYFPKVKAAVIKLSAPLVVGNRIKIVGGENTDITQEVTSMQIDHEPIKKAKKGMSIGVKIGKKVRDGYRVYRV